MLEHDYILFRINLAIFLHHITDTSVHIRIHSDTTDHRLWVHSQSYMTYVKPFYVEFNLEVMPVS